MSHILVLTANPQARALSPALAEKAAQATGAGAVTWLAEATACELPVSGPEPLAAARAALGEAPIDANIVPAEHRKKRLLMADMDSTMIAQECIDELGALLGIKDKIAAITERAMRGELVFEEALAERVALLKGVSRAEIETLFGVITETPGGRALVRTMRANGAHTALVSGGFTLFAGEIGGRIGFDEVHANTLLFAGDVLTGKVTAPVFGPDGKRDALIAIRDRLGLARDDILAVGDGANDLAMMAQAGLGVAFRAKPRVAADADARIDHGDLTALLYLQGYRRADFVD